MEQSGQKGQILVVEDENIVALDIRQSLNRLGYGVPTVAATGEEAVAAAQQWQPDLVLMDIRLRGKMDGIEAATKIRRDQRLPIVYLTAFADARTLDRAKMTEPFGYVLKPFEDQELHSTIEMALHHHKMERRLQENERWLNTILRSIGDAVIATDAVGRISFMNAVAEKLTGCLSEESSGMLFEHVLQIFGHTAGRIQPVHVVQPQSDIESVRSCEDCTLVLPDKSSVPIDCTIAPLLEDGRLVGSVVVFRDISRRKRVESELRASEQRYRDLFEQAQTALLTSELHNQINRSLMASVNVHDVLQAIVDGVGQVITASHVFLHITERENGGLHPGVHNHSGQDRNSADYIDPDIYWPQLVEMVIQEKRPIHLRRPSSQPLENAHRPLGEGYLGLSAGNPFLEHPQGHNFAAVATVPLVYRGKVLGAMTAIGLRSDPPVTEREMELMMVIANQATVAIENARLFEETERRTDELIRSNAELEEFAYVASHDMQEPLRMIRGYARLLAHRYGGDSADTDDFLHYILDGVDRMDILIRDLLLYSQVGQNRSHNDLIDIEQVLDTTMANLLPAILESAAVITRDPLPALAVDGTQMGQLFQNLLSNAIRFRGNTPAKIHITAVSEGDCYRFSIADNGIGIAPEKAGEIFAPFRRLHARSEYPGNGIGLAICKKIVEAHGGTIWLESQEGVGSTFHFTLCTPDNMGKSQ